MNKEGAFQKIILGERGLNHLKGLMGAKELSRHLLKTMNFDQGIVFTWLPKGWEAKRFDDINFKAPLTSPEEMEAKKIKISSGSIVIPGGYIEQPTDAYIQHYIRNCGGVFVVEDFNNVPSEYKPIRDGDSFFFNEDVYCYVDSQHNNTVNIDKAFGASPFWLLFCVLSSYNKPLPVGQQVDYSVIEEISVGVDAIIVGAFDGDGYIFWERDRKQ